MTDQPKRPAHPLRVRKAPPPINPISVSRYISPSLPQVPPPNWGKWAYMRDIELWEAVALSLSLEPDKLPVYLGAYEKLGDDPFRICPPLFLDRLHVACSNCGTTFGFKLVHELKARCLVDLPSFAAWAVNLDFPNMPPELVALALLPEPVAPTAQATAAATPAPVVTVSDGPESLTTAPAWSLKKAPVRNPGYRWQLYQFLKAEHIAGKPCPRAQYVLDQWKSTPPPTLKVIQHPPQQDELEFETQTGKKKRAVLKNIQASINDLLAK